MLKAHDYARQRKGPALVHAHVIRPYSHSLSRRRGPLPARRPSGRPIASATRSADSPRISSRRACATPGRARCDRAAGGRRGAGRVGRRRSPRRSPAPIPSTTTSTLPTSIPTSEQFDTEDDPRFTGDPTTMVDLLNACLKDEMARDPRIVVFGEDVADAAVRRPAPGQGEGRRLQGHLGPPTHVRHRPVYNSPLAEANIVGRAHRHGRARAQARGRDPVLRLHLAGLHADPERAGRHPLALRQQLWKCPMVIRVTYGGYLQGARSTTASAARSSSRTSPACV